jgi:rhodanese-related sulfurtransferase
VQPRGCSFQPSSTRKVFTFSDRKFLICLRLFGALEFFFFRRMAVLRVLLLAATPHAVAWTTLSSSDFYTKINSGFFGLIIDTRDVSEWNNGHIQNATFMHNVHQSHEFGSVLGCRTCNVGVYCHSGVRSKQAATALEDAGFTSVYDLLGVRQWQDAGHALVHTQSSTPNCGVVDGACTWPPLGNTPHAPPLPPQAPDAISPVVLSLSIGGTLVLLLLGAFACAFCRRRSTGGAPTHAKDPAGASISTSMQVA